MARKQTGRDAYEEFADEMQFEIYADSFNEENAYADGDFQLAESIREFKENFLEDY